MARFLDSVDKIMTVYMAAVCTKSFTYKDKVYKPSVLIVSPGLLRGYTCPTGCGGCCPRFSLDYIPTDQIARESSFRRHRLVVVNGKEHDVFSDVQDDYNDHFCRYLNKIDGRCTIYPGRPFSCDFELIRFSMSTLPQPNRLTQRLFGRGWQFLRADGKRGAKCEMTPVSEETVSEVVRKLKRLQVWADYFGIKTCVDTIICLIPKLQQGEYITIDNRGRRWRLL